MAGTGKQELKQVDNLEGLTQRVHSLERVVQQVNQIKIASGQILERLENLERHIQRDERDSERVRNLERELLLIKGLLLRLNLGGDGVRVGASTNTAATSKETASLQEHEISYINRGTSTDGMLTMYNVYENNYEIKILAILKEEFC